MDSSDSNMSSHVSTNSLVDSGSDHCFIITTFTNKYALSLYSVGPYWLRYMDESTSTITQGITLQLGFQSVDWLEFKVFNFLSYLLARELYSCSIYGNPKALSICLPCIGNPGISQMYSPWYNYNRESPSSVVNICCGFCLHNLTKGFYSIHHKNPIFWNP